MEIAANVLVPPFRDQIDRLTSAEQELLRTLRHVDGSFLMNGPFTVIIAHQEEMIGLIDRTRLRPLTVGVKGSTVFLSTKESTFRLVCPDLDEAWIPAGSQPTIGRLGNPVPSPSQPHFWIGRPEARPLRRV